MYVCDADQDGGPLRVINPYSSKQPSPQLSCMSKLNIPMYCFSSILFPHKMFADLYNFDISRYICMQSTYNPALTSLSGYDDDDAARV